MNIFEEAELLKTAIQKTNTHFIIESMNSIIGSSESELDNQLVESEIESRFSNPIQIDHVGSLFEELNWDEKSRVDRMLGSGHSYYQQSFLSQHPKAQAEFDRQSKTEGRGRIRIPVEFETSDLNPNEEVKRHLSDNGWMTHKEGYIAGLTYKHIQTSGDPSKGIQPSTKKVEKRIGSVLDEIKAPDRIKKLYMKDPARASSKTTSYDMILTNHPYDVAGMSTDRGWISCSNIRRNDPRDTRHRGNGPGAKLMAEELNNHTHVAYLVPRGGDIDKDAVGRLAFKHYKDAVTGHSTLFPEGTSYGTTPNGFKKRATAEVRNLFDAKPNTLYLKNRDVYQDGGHSIVSDGTPSVESVDAAWKSIGKPDKDNPMHANLISNIEPNIKYASTKLRKLSKLMGDIHRHLDSGNVDAAMESMHDYSSEHSDLDKLRLVTSDPDTNFRKMHDRLVDSFDVSKHSWRYGSGEIMGGILTRAKSRFYTKPVRTVDEVVNRIRGQHNLGDRFSYSNKMVIPEDHKLGADPIKKITEGLSSAGLLNHDSYQHTFHSIPSGHQKTRGNFYDHAVRLMHAGVDGMESVVNDIAADMHEKLTGERTGWRGMDTIGVASVLHHSKPETRRILADRLGKTVDEIIKPHKKELADRDKKLKELIAKSKLESGE